MTDISKRDVHPEKYINVVPILMKTTDSAGRNSRLIELKEL